MRITVNKHTCPIFFLPFSPPFSFRMMRASSVKGHGIWRDGGREGCFSMRRYEHAS